MTPTELRLRLLRAGYDPLPLVGKAPSMLKDWQHKTNTNADEVEMWGKMWPDARNTGILCQRVPTLDVDVMHEPAAQAIEALAREKYEEAGPILVRFGQRPKRAVPFRTDEPFSKILINLTGPDDSQQKLEFLGAGQQVVVAGIHPGTGKPYDWFGGEPGEVPREELPYIRGEEARQLVEDAAGLLIREHGFKRADGGQKPNGQDQPDTGECADWDRLIGNILDGSALHDSLRDLAASCIAKGMRDGDTVDLLRSLMRKSRAERDDRWLERYREIPRSVRSGREKFGEKATAQVRPVELFDPWQRYAVPAFPLDILPSSIKHFVTTQSEIIGGDRSAVAMAALAALSGALDHQFALKMMRYGDWWVSPRLWVLLVGDPSTKRTPIINAATHELDRLQASAWSKYQNDKREYIAAGGDPEEFEAPEPPRFVAYDVTIEKLGMILGEQDRGILIKRDELAGWIGQMEKYSTGRASFADRAFWLKAYDGGPWTVDRASREDIRIANLSCSILGGIQPARLAELSGLTSDGLLQRFLPVLVNSSTFPIDHAVTAEAFRYAELLRRLAKLGPQKLLLADDAVTAMEALRKHLHDLEHASGGHAEGFQGFVGKLAGLAGSLVLILTMAGDPDRAPGTRVQAGTIEDVDLLVREFILPHAFAFYHSGTGSDPLKRVASYVLTSGKTRVVPSDFTVNVADMRGLGLWDVNQRVSPLVAGGWLVPGEPGPVCKAWTVTPQVHEFFRERARAEADRKSKTVELLKSLRARKGGKPDDS